MRYALFLLILLPLVASADGPVDNIPDKVRRIPPPGIMVPAAERSELEKGVADLGKEIAQLRMRFQKNATARELLPDVEIFFNAVHYALKYDEFYDVKQFDIARAFLKQGLTRAKELKDGKPSWIHQTGLVVRGYVSRIDGSVQPYGLVVPASYQANTPHRHRLDIWFHGRGEKLTELSFIDGRQKSPGEFTPKDAFVLHPYGRYCNANHFAGEVDTFEAMEHVQKHYPIDVNRIAVRGFSMGGAACWHFATHHAWRWAAAAPGAGFSETPEFLKFFQKEKLEPTWYQEKLWKWHDCNYWALNLHHCPTVAYSGENDIQKQAADIMVEAMSRERMRLVHIIGPKTGHSYHPNAKVEINRRIDAIVEKGREVTPKKVFLETWTLRYPRMHWLTVEGMKEHWTNASVSAQIVSDGKVKILTDGVTALTLDMEPGTCPLGTDVIQIVFEDESLKEQSIEVRGSLSDRSWTVHLKKDIMGWREVKNWDEEPLRKRPGLQGPIDDAFMDSFLMVRPTGKPLNELTGKWVEGELSHALDHWRRQFRGVISAKKDVDVTKEDIASNNLVLWGDPQSNAILAKITKRLPIDWTKDSISYWKQEHGTDHHVLVLIAPNPLNPKKYVVLNSGFTFREFDYLNNARQVPRLPDWAVLDVRQPPTSQWPARVVGAGFFDEFWRFNVLVPEKKMRER